MKKVSKSILKSFAFLELRKSRDLLQVYLLLQIRIDADKAVRESENDLFI
jgi:hypothetical protein